MARSSWTEDHNHQRRTPPYQTGRRLSRFFVDDFQAARTEPATNENAPPRLGTRWGMKSDGRGAVTTPTERGRVIGALAPHQPRSPCGGPTPRRGGTLPPPGVVRDDLWQRRGGGARNRHRSYTRVRAQFDTHAYVYTHASTSPLLKLVELGRFLLKLFLRTSPGKVLALL